MSRTEFQGLGTRILLPSEQTRGRFALVEHDLGPRLLGAQVGDDVRMAGPGELVVKPRGIPHAFWNAGDDELRFLETISPGGFAHYFEDLAPHLPPSVDVPDFEAIGAVMARYALTMDMATIEPLVREHGLRT